jgi:hypothetical protein
MAITVNQRPQQFQPIYNPYIYVLSSDNSSQQNFKIAASIYDTSDSGNSVYITTLQNPTNTNGYVVFDLSRVVRDYLTHDFELGVSLTQNCPNSIKRITVFTQEVFGSPASSTGTIYTYGDATATDSRYVWNSALPFEEFAPYNQNNYLLKYSNYSSNRWLTNADIVNGLKMSQDQNGYAYLLLENLDNTDNSINLIDYVRIKTYTSSGTLIDTYDVNIDYITDLSLTTGYMVRIPIGTYNLNQINALDFISGSQPVITDSVAYYTIQTMSNFYDDGYPLRVNVVDYCDSPQVFRLHFLNRLGGFDSINFDRYYTQTTQIERKNYKRPYGSVTSGTWSYSASDRNNVNMINTAKKQYNIQTNWISETEASWLEELLTSPVVFWEADNSTLYSINILDSAYETKYHQKDKVFNLTLTFELTFDYKSQTY